VFGVYSLSFPHPFNKPMKANFLPSPCSGPLWFDRIEAAVSVEKRVPHPRASETQYDDSF